MSNTFLPPIQPYFPTTFLERGVAVPFTTPLLFGSRARMTWRSALELILPNPTGGRGVYVLDRDTAREFAHPTVHDRELMQRIAALPAITPPAIRSIGRDIATTGLAGEEAMDAARRSVGKSQRELADFLDAMLAALVRQLDIKLFGPSAPDLDQQARQTIDRIAPRIGQPVEWVARNLDQLCKALCNVGITSLSGDPRVRRTLDRVRETGSQIAGSRLCREDESLASYADVISEAADLAVSLGTALLNQALVPTTDAVGLLRGWSAKPEAVAQVMSRPDWLLNGWEQICVLWDDATQPAAQRAALVEIGHLIPVLPREATEWAGVPLDIETVSAPRRLVPVADVWRNGSLAPEQIARNERLRAIAA